MTSIIQSLFPPAIYNAQNLHFNRFAQFGLVTAALATIVYQNLSEEQKEWFTANGISLVHKVTDPANVTDDDIRRLFWKSKESLINCSLAGPIFYGTYHAVHTSGHDWMHHINQAILRGFSGTFKSIPVTAAMFAAAGIVIPYVQNRMMEGGALDKTQAAKKAEEVSFLMAVPFELFAETLGYGLSPSQLTAKLTAIATVSLMGRMITGTLPQFQDLAQKNGEVDSAEKNKRFAYKALGTSLFQFPLNAAVKSMEGNTGTQGFFKYLKYGNIQGMGSWRGGALQFARVGFQRAAYFKTWDELTDRSLAQAALSQDGFEKPSRVQESD